MKKAFKELALQAGGSHYPDVGGELLEKFSELMLAEVIDIIDNLNCKDEVYTSYDLQLIDGAKATIINAIKEKFN